MYHDAQGREIEDLEMENCRRDQASVDAYVPPYPPHPDDGLSYCFDHNTHEWVDPIDPETGLTPEEALALEIIE